MIIKRFRIILFEDKFENKNFKINKNDYLN